MEKKEIRKQIREIKKQYTLEDKKRMSASVWQQVEHNEVFQRARVVLAYWSMDDEVFTHDFVCKWAEEKTILLPCVKGDELEIRYFDGREKTDFQFIAKNCVPEKGMLFRSLSAGFLPI